MSDTTLIERPATAGALIQQAGMRFNAGHGLNYFNVRVSVSK